MYFQICSFIIKIYTWFQILISKAKKKENTFFKLLNVYDNKNDDITESFKLSMHICDSQKIKVIWIFHNEKFINMFDNTSIKHFPPYNFIDCKTKTSKIVAGLLVNRKTKDIETVTSTIKQYAGPKHNFYSDIDYVVNTKDIYGICDKLLVIIFSDRKQMYDLNNNHIL